MASVPAPSPDQAGDALQKLSLDSQSKKVENSDAAKKSSTLKHGSLDGRDVKPHRNPLSERFTPPPPLPPGDPNLSYVPNSYASFYYGGYEGPVSEWGGELPRYVSPNGAEMNPGLYGDNGSMMFTHAYGYAPYGGYTPASPVPATEHEYGPQQYQFPAPYYQSSIPPSASIQVSGSQTEISTTVSAGQAPVSIENAKGAAYGKSNGNNKAPTPVRSSQVNSSANISVAYGRGVIPSGLPSTGYQDPIYGHDGVRSPVPWLDGAVYSDGQPRLIPNSSAVPSATNMSRNQNVGPQSYFMDIYSRPTSGMGSINGYLNRMYDNNRFYNCGNLVSAGSGYSPGGYDFRSSGRSWMYDADRKYNRSRVGGNGSNAYGYVNADGLDEKHRGPRSDSKILKGFGPPVTIAVKGQNLPANAKLTDSGKHTESTKLNESAKLPLTASVYDGQYNKEEFPVNYLEAKFFVIKSYSEDDVHKSIKYSVWASTPTGNKKLDAAYQESKEKSADCPVFLFFSVNTSGQFVGVAEMVGPLDFGKTLNYWQQDKWSGCFPLKWHIVKDVPNNLLKHITLENNENKPVTNSRDTQEVNLEEGLEMLKIFKEHVSKTCMLDDFVFYEGREKLLQERKLKQQPQKQIYDGKLAEVHTVENLKSQKPLHNGQAMVDEKIEQDVEAVLPNTGNIAKG